MFQKLTAAFQKTFFLNIEVANFLTCWSFFAYICLFCCSKFEYLSYSMNFLFISLFYFLDEFFPSVIARKLKVI